MARGTERKIEGFVIRKTPYKNSDAMVNVLTREGLFSFSARGVMKPTSKNASSVEPLCYSSFLLSNSSLKEASLIRGVNMKDDLSLMASYSFIYEISSKFLNEDDAVEAFPYLERAMDSLREGFSPLSVDILYLSAVLKLIGYGLNVDCCSLCSRKEDIVGFSMEDGGLICRDDFERKDFGSSHLLKMDPRHMNILRYCFKYKPSDMGKVSFEKDECIYFLNLLSEYAFSVLSVKINSLQLLKI